MTRRRGGGRRQRRSDELGVHGALGVWRLARPEVIAVAGSGQGQLAGAATRRRISVSCNLRQARVPCSRKPAAAPARAGWGRHPCLPVRAASLPPVSMAEHPCGTGKTGQGCPANWQARMPAPPGWRRRQAAGKKLRCTGTAPARPFHGLHGAVANTGSQLLEKRSPVLRMESAGKRHVAPCRPHRRLARRTGRAPAPTARRGPRRPTARLVPLSGSRQPVGHTLPQIVVHGSRWGTLLVGIPPPSSSPTARPWPFAQARRCSFVPAPGGCAPPSRVVPGQ